MKDVPDYRDWITLSLAWLCFPLVTWLTWRLFGTLDQARRRSSDHSRRVGAEHAIFSRVSPLTWSKASAVCIWLSHFTDVCSYTYSSIAQKWNWYVVVADSSTLLFSGVAYVLIVTTFVYRCHNTFQSTDLQHSACIYYTVCVLAAVLLLLTIVVVLLSLARQWQLVFYAFMAYVVTLLITTSMLIHMFESPLRKLAQKSERPKFLHVAVRVTVVTSFALISTSTLTLVGAFAFFICGECNVTYVYYNLAFYDRVANLLCLAWVLKSGSEGYMKMCARVHECCLLRFHQEMQPVEAAIELGQQ